MEKALQRAGIDESTVSGARLLSVLDTAVDGIIVIDEQARILVFNKACERLFGRPASEVVGQNVKLIMPADYAAEHDSYLRHYLDTGERRIIGIGREVRGQHSDGTVFPLELSVGEASTPDGRQFIGIIRDLRPRKQFEERLSQLQAQLVHMARVNAMDEMGAAVAHELNQPLTAVMLYLQAVARRMKSGPAPADAMTLDVLSRAVKEAERAGSIIQRMRQFVEKREPDRRPTDVTALIDEVLELTLIGPAAEVVEIRRELEPDLPQVEVDPVQIQQVLANLVRNAVEAVRHRDRPWIRVAARRADGRIAVDVADSGEGIPREAVRSLFKAFATNKRSGLGLGLAISRTIAQNHGGDLVVDPGGHGKGAVFTLILPTVGARPAAAGTAEDQS
jgi:two-component system sensor kinase FixL